MLVLLSSQVRVIHPSFLLLVILKPRLYLVAASLRLQVSPGNDFGGRTPYQAFAEYIGCCLLLFLTVLNYMG